jgi:16S rRNA (cytosine967-C5)-methyltransferase
VQDEGSQLAALACAAAPGMQVADVCAGGGGKTLALAAAMENKGQIFAYDIDGRRLAPLKERLDRAGVRNAQIRTPMRTKDALADLRDRMDVVLVDAPCTGSGTWRRSPDSKWRLRPNALAKRLVEQREALAMAAPLVKAGGRLVYVTCSVLPEENEDQMAVFLGSHSDFAAVGFELGAPAYERALGRQMTPLRTGCDGFYIAVLERRR